MNSTFFRQKTLTGFSSQHHIKKATRQLGFVGMVRPTDQSFPTPLDISGDVPYSDPLYEIDFYSLPCDKIYELIQDLTNFMQSARLTSIAVTYYAGKLQIAQDAYNKCNNKPTATDTGSGGGTSTSPTTPTTSGGGGGNAPLGDPILIPIIPIRDDSPSSPTSAGISTGGFGGGGAGGGASSPTKKKFNWWIVVAGVCIALSAYQTYKQKAA